jgi:hypothetical protein
VTILGHSRNYEGKVRSILVEEPEGREYLEDPDVDEKVILKWF